MDRQSITSALLKHGCEQISAQTVAKTFAYISYKNLCAEQVNNRSSAQWKKANFIICSKDKGSLFSTALTGWQSLAAYTQDQVLFIQGEDGFFHAYNWFGKELNSSVSEIIQKYSL